MSVEIQSLPFTQDDVGKIKVIQFSGIDYQLRLRKNEEDDYFTMDVFNADGEFIYSSRLTYGYYFVDSIVPELPFQILPFDPKQLFNDNTAQTEITDDNLGNEVILITNIEII